MFQFNLGFGGVTAPMEYPQDQQRTPREPLPEFPDIKDTSVGTLRLEGTLAKRLPSMPSGATGDLSYSDSRRLAAEQMMDDMRVSYAVSNAYKRRGQARAKARARQNDRQLKNSDSQGRINRRQLQGQTKRMEKSAILRNARDYLGMGTDTFR
tara:strand:- start:37 stop:495 length:459 start_codon:yes stop_codon:yes gene_type:complete